MVTAHDHLILLVARRLRLSLHCGNGRSLRIHLLAKPVLTLSIHSAMLSHLLLIRRLRQRIVPVEAHIGLRIGHAVLNSLLILWTLNLAILVDITLQQIKRISITQYRRPVLLLLKICMMLQFNW